MVFWTAGIDETFVPAGIKKALGTALDEIKMECIKGVSQCWKFNNGRFITRIEHKELVIVAFTGRNTSNVFSAIYQSAKNGGFQSIRIHTNNPKWVRFIRIKGFVFDEVAIGIYRLEVA